MINVVCLVLVLFASASVHAKAGSVCSPETDSALAVLEGAFAHEARAGDPARSEGVESALRCLERAAKDDSGLAWDRVAALSLAVSPEANRALRHRLAALVARSADDGARARFFEALRGGVTATSQARQAVDLRDIALDLITMDPSTLAGYPAALGAWESLFDDVVDRSEGLRLHAVRRALCGKSDLLPGLSRHAAKVIRAAKPGPWLGDCLIDCLAEPELEAFRTEAREQLARDVWPRTAIVVLTDLADPLAKEAMEAFALRRDNDSASVSASVESRKASTQAAEQARWWIERIKLQGDLNQLVSWALDSSKPRAGLERAWALGRAIEMKFPPEQLRLRVLRYGEVVRDGIPDLAVTKGVVALSTALQEIKQDGQRRGYLHADDWADVLIQSGGQE